MSMLRRKVLPFFLLIWLLVVVTAYFVVQKPWPPSGAAVALRSVADLGLAGLLLGSAAGFGSRLVGDLPELHPFETVSLQAGIGLGVISLVILGLGTVGLISPISSWLLLGLLQITHWRRSLAWVKNFFEGLSGLLDLSGIVAWVGLVVSVSLLGISLLEAMAPPLKWDSLVYHLALPQEYLRSGHIGFVPGNLFVGFPQLAEMNFTWAMGLGSGRTAAILGWLVGLVAVLGLAGLATRKFGQVGLWLAPAVLLSGASLWQGLAWAYVDHWVLLNGLLLIIALEQYENSRERSWLWLAGAAIGFAASSKYTGAFLGLAAILWLVLIWYGNVNETSRTPQNTGEQSLARSQVFHNLIRDIALITIISLFIFSPWLIKNWLTSGNPVYPFLFPGREVDSLRQTFHAQGQSIIRPLSLPILPWLVTILGVEGGAGFNSSIGPLYLALIPGLILGLSDEQRETKIFIRRAGAVALLGWLIWGVAGLLADPLSRSRHYYGFLPVLCLLAVAGYKRVHNLKVAELRLGWVITRLVLFAFLLVGIDGFFHLAEREPVRVILGQQEKSEYLADQLGWYGPAMAYLENLPTDSRVEMLWEARSYYCSRECRPDVILDKWWYWRRTIGSSDRIADHLQTNGITHVLIYDFGAAFEQRSRELQDQADWAALEKFQRDELVLIQRFGDGYSLYTWRYFE